MALPWITGLGIQAGGGGVQGTVEAGIPVPPLPLPGIYNSSGPLSLQPSSPPLTLVLDAGSLMGRLAACTPTSRVPRSDL